MITARFHPCRTFRLPLGWLAVVAVALSGCAGSRTITSTEPSDFERPTVRHERSSDQHAALEALLRDEIRTWDGTPHLWGGQTRAGADCSGFVMRVYADALGVHLPRTTEDQAVIGEKIGTRALEPGDLVFFRTAPKTRHVGIYLSNGEFAHASTSEGVRISDLDSDYWRRTYWMSRRVLPESLRMAMRSDEPEAFPVPAPSMASEPIQERETRAVRTPRPGW